MATIIDSLLVTLGLDTKGFQQGTKQTQADIIKMRKQADQAAKEMEAAGKRAAMFFSEVKNQALSLAAVFLGGLGLKEFAVQTIQTDAAMGRLANNLGISITELSRWEIAANLAGGSAKGIDSAFKTLSDSIQTLQLTGNVEGPLQYFNSLGIALRDADTGKIRSVTDLMMDYSRVLSEAKTPAEAMGIAKRLGIDEETANVLKQGTANLKAFLAEADKIGPATEADGQAAQQLSSDFAKLTESTKALGRSLLTDLAPALDWVINKLTDLVQGKGNAVSEFFNGIVDKLGGTKGWNIGGELYDVFHPKGATSITPSDGASSSFPGTTSAAPASGAAGNPNAPRSLRNNNPGNIEYGSFARRHGATGSDGRFAVFPTLQAGQAAQVALLDSYRTDKKDRRDTIAGIVSKWAPASDNNNVPAYISDVSKATGIDPNATVTKDQLPAIAAAMAGHEGAGSKYANSVLAGLNSSTGKAGGSTSEVNIGTITVNTKATDAAGIAKDMKGAISANGLVGQANTGLN